MACSVACLVLMPAPAAAGGFSTFQWNGRPDLAAVFAPGDEAVGQTSVWLKGDRERGGIEDGPYFAYMRRLGPDQDYSLEKLRPGDVPLGRVEVTAHLAVRTAAHA